MPIHRASDASRSVYSSATASKGSAEPGTATAPTIHSTGRRNASSEKSSGLPTTSRRVSGALRSPFSWLHRKYETPSEHALSYSIPSGSLCSPSYGPREYQTFIEDKSNFQLSTAFAFAAKASKTYWASPLVQKRAKKMLRESLTRKMSASLNNGDVSKIFGNHIHFATRTKEDSVEHSCSVLFRGRRKPKEWRVCLKRSELEAATRTSSSRETSVRT